MKPLAFSPAAEADIDGIWDYSAETWGPDQADRHTDEIRDACLALAHDRKQGRPVDVRLGYLRLSTGSHVIYYRDRGDRLGVMRRTRQGGWDQPGVVAVVIERAVRMVVPCPTLPRQGAANQSRRAHRSRSSLLGLSPILRLNCRSGAQKRSGWSWP
ncbi:type II toxin-antitoxin system RelE/ParE family toxin [Paracoccus aestuarii]|uniref:Toxin-antitoxin system protein n=1 Tax=Paracoccus aestuarii TaxID=453842 RepID=J7K6Z2_9RHOB|nr:toxin-antitoxin system protein [Paracoccus aestuarii]RJL03317.1 type II toxin-antitoxin system RelE/ParE family toxin [Paracoccus aestuarii]